MDPDVIEYSLRHGVPSEPLVVCNLIFVAFLLVVSSLSSSLMAARNSLFFSSLLFSFRYLSCAVFAQCLKPLVWLAVMNQIEVGAQMLNNRRLDLASAFGARLVQQERQPQNDLGSVLHVIATLTRLCSDYGTCVHLLFACLLCAGSGGVIDSGL